MSKTTHHESSSDNGSGATICIPRTYFDDRLAQATTYDELQVLLATIRLLAESANDSGEIEEESIMRDTQLNAVLSTTATSQSSTSRIIRALNQAVIRGALLRLSVLTKGRQRIVYQLADRDVPISDSAEIDETAFDGDATLPSSLHDAQAASVYAAYEDNIGMLTPLVADQIRLALELYPASWIHEAIGEAVAYNRRQWRYIQRVLQNWSADGRISGPAHEVNHATNKRGPARALDTD
jgi:DnaD/phage-associated family protein